MRLKQSAILSAIPKRQPNGWTPLAETLAEAGLYFAGMQSWYDSGVHLHLTHAAAVPEKLHHYHDRRRTDQGPRPPALRHRLH